MPELTPEILVRDLLLAKGTVDNIYTHNNNNTTQSTQPTAERLICLQYKKELKNRKLKVMLCLFRKFLIDGLTLFTFPFTEYAPEIAGQEDYVDINNNPFALPQDDIFSLRAREKEAKELEKAKLKTMKIWDKGQNQNARLSMVRSERLSSRNKDKLNPQKDRMFQGRRREKENMDDFIQKKRDMFLIQMSLDTKRQEIQK